MGVAAGVEACLSEAADQASAATPELVRLAATTATRWPKLDHLLYLPVLGLSRPRDLYYYQGPGLRVLYGFTYKYLPLEHFLGRLSRLAVGGPLAAALSQLYSQAWYPGDSPLGIFVDWHVKPHWTKQPSHSGHITMWGRVMPGTKQLLLNGPEGHLLAGWDVAIDSHFSRVLVDLEAQLAELWQRPIAYTICDSEGGGLPLGQRYAAAGRCYLSLLPWQGYRLSDFEVIGAWQPVQDDPTREAVAARWHAPQRAAEEVRQLILLRPLGQTDPSRVYAGRLPDGFSPAEVPTRYRQRWASQERVIRELVNGANLNVNYGYSTQAVPQRTRQRRWAEAQTKVEVSEHDLAQHDQALVNLQRQLVTLRQRYQQDYQTQFADLTARQVAFLDRQQAGQALRRCQQRLTGCFRRLDHLTATYRRRRHRLLDQLSQHRHRRRQVQADLLARQAARDEIDTQSLCRERELEKDQLMLNLQLLLGSLHDWVRCHYCPPRWQRLELDTATELIYRKAGWVRWGVTEIDVTLEPYRYPEHQQAMVETCRRFNAANLHWRDGRRLRIQVAPAG